MKINIRDLFSQLDYGEYKDIEIENTSDNHVNIAAIKESVLKNIDRGRVSTSTSRKKIRKKSFGGIWAAALIICLTATTVFAFANIDFFKEIFGKNAEVVEKNIQNILAVTENEDFILTVESMLTDGNRNYVIISLENKSNEELGEMVPFFSMKKLTKSDSKDRMYEHNEMGKPSIGVMGTEKIESLDATENKNYYLFTYSTSDNMIGEKVELSLSGMRGDGEKLEKYEKELSVTFDVKENNSLQTVDMKELQSVEDKYYITEIKYSNLGMNIKGKYIKDIEGVPIVKIQLKYKDGSMEELSRKIEYKDKFGFSYHRFKDEFNNIVIFKELIDINEIESIIIEDKEYKIN